MQWTLTYVLLASCAVISASDHGVRSKRDLSFIKRYFMSKILGHHATNTTKILNPSENYKLFRIPGHEKILVKAVPKVPVVLDTEAAYPVVSEVTETEPVPVHPSIAIVSKYLGTNDLNDTLFALKGVKNLLQSGVLTAKREGIDKISTFKDGLLQPVLVEPSNIAVGHNKRPVMVYPTLGETLIGKIIPGHRYPNLKVPTHYSYKQVNKGGVTSYTAHDSQKVLVTEIKRPVSLPAPVSHRIWEILSLGSYRLPTSPAVRPVFGMEKVVLPPVKMVPGYHSNDLYHDGLGTMHATQMVLEVEGDTPVVIKKVTNPAISKVEDSNFKVRLPSDISGYSYNHVHNDGSVTTHFGSGKVVEHEGEKSALVITEPGRPTLVVSGGPPAPFPVYNEPIIKAPSSTVYSYNHVHNNEGSKTTYFGSGHVVDNKVERPAVFITEPGRPTVFVPDVDRPPAFIPVYNRHSAKGSAVSGFSYNQVHNDGSVTTYSGSGDVVEHVGEKPALVITESGTPTVVVADIEGPPPPIPVYNLPKVKAASGSGYAYSHVHNDGSMTTYTGSGHVIDHVGEQPPVVITEHGRPTLVMADVERPLAPVPVYNFLKKKAPSGSGYSYNHVHNDGSMTTYTGSGHVVEHLGEQPSVVITEPGRPTVVVADVEGPPAPIPVHNLPKVKEPSGSRYSYSHVYDDGSKTTYAGSGHVDEHLGVQPPVVITEPGRPTVVAANVERLPVPVLVYNLPKKKEPSGSGHSYSHVHNDGSKTTYAGSGHVVEHLGEQPSVVVTKPGRPTVVVANVERPPVPVTVYDLPNKKESSGSGYSYSHVHNDGSMITYTGSEHVVKHEGEKPTAVFTEPGRPTVVVADVEKPPAPIPVYNFPKKKAPSGSGYSYSHVHNDGSMTTYAGSGHVVEHLGEQPSVVITEPGRPTVVVADVEGPPAPIPVYNLPKVKEPSGSRYTYSHVYNDGSKTTYAGSGNVDEHLGVQPPVVITEPGRPTVVVADVERPPVPVSVYNFPEKTQSSGSGYSYSHVHNDGSMITYAGSGHVVEHLGEQLPVIITEPAKPTVVVADVVKPSVSVPAYNSPKVKVPSGSSFSNDRVHNDGLVTHSGSGQVVEHEEKKSGVVISAYGKPTVVMADAERLPASMPDYNLPNAPSGSGYTYNHVHNDGFRTTYSGLGHVDHVGEKTAMVITEPARPNAVVADVEGPPAPIPLYNLPKVKAPSGSGFFYNNVHNDGSVTIHSGLGHVVEHEGERPPVVITEPGRPTVVIADVEGPPAPMPGYNLPKAPSGSGYYYDHVRNDGLITTYMGSGKINEHRGGRPEAIITEPGKPTVVMSGIDGPPAPIPVHGFPNMKVPFHGSGYTYDQVNTVIVQERPEHVYKYEQVRNNYEMPQRQHIQEQVKVNVNSQNEYSTASSSAPTGFSYKTVHEDGSVTDYSDIKVTEGAKLDRPMLYPTGLAETHQHSNDNGHSADAEKCKNLTRSNSGVINNCKSQSFVVSSNFSHYSYKTVSQDGSTSYSGSGHVKVESDKFDAAAHDKEVSSSIANAPLLITKTGDDSPQKGTTTPILSQYSYKQINHHQSDDIQDEKVNKVTSAINKTSESQGILVEVSEAPKDHVFVPPPEVDAPMLKKPVEEAINTTKKTVAVPYTTRKSFTVSTSTKSSHFKPKRVYRKRVRTSTSRSSLRASAAVTTTPQVSSSTAVTTEGSLSANPIVVLPEEERVFSFKQERSDGSSITVVGNKDNKVSAVLEEPKTSPNRGDIPESSF